MTFETEHVYPGPDPNFDAMSTEEIRSFISETESHISFAREHGADELFVIGLCDQRNRAAAELQRRNGTTSPASPDNVEDPIQGTLIAAGLVSLTTDSGLLQVEEAVRNLQLTINGADPIRRATVREAALKRLEEIGISAPARLLDAAIPPGNGSAGRDGVGTEIIFAEPEPWPKAVDGAALLSALTVFIERFLILPPHAAKAIALWIMHAYTLDAFHTSPILAASSPTKRAGKTTLLELVSTLVPRGVSASNITPASLFRAVEKFKPVLLIDEADTFLRESDELRGVLNASHRRASAFVVRTVGDEHEPKLFSTWCAKAIALIGKLPDTLEDRSVLIAMRRRAPKETVERFRPDKARIESEELRRQAARWSADHIALLGESDPNMPESLNDRAADNWRPLIAIADRAGGDWPRLSRAAAVAISEGVSETNNSALILLLEDLRSLFEERNGDRLASADICYVLGSREDRPWSEWKRGNSITERQLARLLESLDVRPRQLWIDGKNARGYHFEQFEDAFSRYLPSNPPDIPSDPLGPLEPAPSAAEPSVSASARNPSDPLGPLEPAPSAAEPSVSASARNSDSSGSQMARNPAPSAAPSGPSGSNPPFRGVWEDEL